MRFNAGKFATSQRCTGQTDVMPQMPDGPMMPDADDARCRALPRVSREAAVECLGNPKLELRRPHQPQSTPVAAAYAATDHSTRPADHETGECHCTSPLCRRGSGTDVRRTVGQPDSRTAGQLWVLPADHGTETQSLETYRKHGMFTVRGSHRCPGIPSQ